MRIITISLLVLLLTASVGCHKTGVTQSVSVPPSPATFTVTGTLQKQGVTTYMYGTHILVVDPSTSYVLESTSIDLDAYVGAHVRLTAINTGYHAEMGPDMYNVTSITTVP